MCDWDALDAMLGAWPLPDVLAIRRGREVPAAVPRSLAQLRGLFTRGVGVVVRHAERHHAALAAYCAALARDIAGEQRVLVFATPAGVNGFFRM